MSDPANIKSADTLSRVHELIRERWSPRAFADREVSREDIHVLLDAARWAASSGNEQPWRFVVATKAEPEAYHRILETLVEANQMWARTAPVLMIGAARHTVERNGEPNYYALHDAGQALANLMLQATGLGLHAHAMGGFSKEQAREVLGIPEEFAVTAAVAVGYLGAPDMLPEKYQKLEIAPRQRKPIAEIAFDGKWGQPIIL